MAHSTEATKLPDTDNLTKEPQSAIVGQLTTSVLHSGTECTLEMAGAIACQYVRDHPAFDLAQHIHQLLFATRSHEIFRDRIQKLDWTAKLIENGHPPFGWNQSLSGSDDLEFHVDFMIEDPLGEEHSVELTNGVWINPIEIPGFVAPTIDE